MPSVSDRGVVECGVAVDAGDKGAWKLLPDPPLPCKRCCWAPPGCCKALTPAGQRHNKLVWQHHCVSGTSHSDSLATASNIHGSLRKRTGTAGMPCGQVVVGQGGRVWGVTCSSDLRNGCCGDHPDCGSEPDADLADAVGDCVNEDRPRFLPPSAAAKACERPPPPPSNPLLSGAGMLHAADMGLRNTTKRLCFSLSLLSRVSAPVPARGPREASRETAPRALTVQTLRPQQVVGWVMQLSYGTISTDVHDPAIKEHWGSL